MITITPEKLFSFEDYLTYDDGTDNRSELVDGRLEIVNPPTIGHMLIAKFVANVLEAEIARVSLPWMCFQETGVRTGFRKSRLTDVCVVSREQARELVNKSAVFETPPLLVVEVVSPESVNRDYRYKRSEYAAVGIPEYWIIDPILKKISVLRLDEGLYEEEVLTENQSLVSQTFPELNLTVAPILEAGNLT
ncbi:MAG TPA: Uma2 family endonuclease [Oscillatoriaceae cyanobacterium M33_DOE_052]|uniref:Uma2 family endonuclease n=1 Tax=Planktothricoides sp. SpSt-374 TaxID=2282167 RepID=A0A7C4A106_9CYAN|nr:Uma2 family endonuclease [Oscillatoriaceae cyanobacterium M33_DOE_052]